MQGRDKLGSGDLQIETITYKIDNQQGPTYNKVVLLNIL